MAEIKQLADEAAYEREHGEPPKMDPAQMESAYKSYSERLTTNRLSDIRRKCFKDYSALCPQGFVAV